MNLWTITENYLTHQEQQDKCIHLLKTAEKMAAEGHYAGAEAKSRAYSVLEAATALHETCDTRTALLNQAILFFRLAQAVSEWWNLWTVIYACRVNILLR